MGHFIQLSFLRSSSVSIMPSTSTVPPLHDVRIMDEDESSNNSTKAVGAPVPDERMPASLRNMSQEERDHLELRMRRKIDYRLMPMMVLMYIMNYLDRNNIAAARLAGLEDELNLTSTQYQVCLEGKSLR